MVSEERRTERVEAQSQDDSLKKEKEQIVDEFNKLSINDKLNLIYNVMSPNKKNKPFKLKWGLRRGWKQKLKKGYALVIYIFNNKSLDIKWREILNEMIYIPETKQYHSASANYMMHYNGFPVLIIPSWSLKPLCPKEHFEQTVKEGEAALPQKVLINVMKMSQIEPPKKKFNGKWLLIGLVVVGVVLYIVSKVMK